VLSGLIVPFGFLALAVDFLWPWGGAIFAKLAGWKVALLLESVNTAAEWSAGAFRVPEPPPWVLLLFYVALAAAGLAVLAGRKRFWLRVPLSVAVSLAVVCAVHPFAPALVNGAIELTLLDVGQGDSVFVAFPGGRTLLMDGGGSYGAARVGGVRTGLDIGEQVVSPYLWQRGIKRLDAIALSHAHNDHLDGLNAVLENFSVGELWYGREVKSPAFLALLERAKARGTRLRQLQRGDRMEWDGVQVSVLWPEAALPAETAKNDDSLVLRLEYGSESFLLTGDVERPVEEALVASGAPLDVDFLKVAHHASRTSSTSEFLSASTPRVAAASFGEDNPFGYPHREVVTRLCAARVMFYRTDQDGAVSVRTTGHGVQAQSYAEEIGLSRRSPDPCVAVNLREASGPEVLMSNESKTRVSPTAKPKKSTVTKRAKRTRKARN
jgi:competence protein ComEC